MAFLINDSFIIEAIYHPCSLRFLRPISLLADTYRVKCFPPPHSNLIRVSVFTNKAPENPLPLISILVIPRFKPEAEEELCPAGIGLSNFSLCRGERGLCYDS